jgi:hypothetical protein
MSAVVIAFPRSRTEREDLYGRFDAARDRFYAAFPHPVIDNDRLRRIVITMEVVADMAEGKPF